MLETVLNRNPKSQKSNFNDLYHNSEHSYTG